MKLSYLRLGLKPGWQHRDQGGTIPNRFLRIEIGTMFWNGIDGQDFQINLIRFCTINLSITNLISIMEKKSIICFLCILSFSSKNISNVYRSSSYTLGFFKVDQN